MNPSRRAWSSNRYFIACKKTYFLSSNWRRRCLVFMMRNWGHRGCCGLQRRSGSGRLRPRYDSANRRNSQGITGYSIFVGLNTMWNIAIARWTIADLILCSCRRGCRGRRGCWPWWRLLRLAICFICWISSSSSWRGRRQRLSSHHWDNTLGVLTYPPKSTQVAWNNKRKFFNFNKFLWFSFLWWKKTSF